MAGTAWPNSSSRRLRATHRSACRHSRVQVILNGTAWERIVLSFSHVVATSWPSLWDLPEGTASLGLPEGQALVAESSGGCTYAPRLARPPCDALSVTILHGSAPPLRVPVRIRLIGSQRTALLDRPPPCKKMCGALDPE